MEEDILKLDSVDKYNKLFGLETLHPQVSVIDLSKATLRPSTCGSTTASMPCT